ncbi:MAG: hypothetical protein ACRBC3_08935 [Burkholderiaceae bacterium]
MINSYADSPEVTGLKESRGGFWRRLFRTILLSRERSAISQIARFDPGMAERIREARNAPSGPT